MEKQVVFHNQGHKLFGMFHLPDEPNRPPFPAVVMLHGFTGNRIEPHNLFVKAARRFAVEGVLTLRFDFRCCGESQGIFEDLSVEGMISDALAALRLIRGREDVISSRVALCGLSLGGAIAASVAGLGESGVNCLVLWAAVADLRRAFYTKAPDSLVANYGKRDIHDHFGNALSQRLLNELMDFKPVERVRSYAGPVLIVHGTADESIPSDEALRYGKALKSHGRVGIRMVDGANHTFAGLSWEKELIDTTALFLKKHLQGPESEYKVK